MEPLSSPDPDGPRGGSSPAWLYARPLWAGLSIIAMWLAARFVGLFGPDIARLRAGQTSLEH